MFNAEALYRIDLLQKAFVLTTGAIAASFIAVNAMGVALAKSRLQDQRFDPLDSIGSLGQSLTATQVSVQLATIGARDLTLASDSELHNLLAETLGYFVTLSVPTRSSVAVAAAIHATQTLVGMTPKTGVSLVNELNAALLYENTMSRIEAINAERAQRMAAGDIG
jgi:hypothetical protein